MLYVAIDQHAKQITVCVRNEDGDTVLRRQVSTRREKIEAFFARDENKPELEKKLSEYHFISKSFISRVVFHTFDTL